MSRIPKIDTALRNFEDSLEGVTTPGEVYERIDQLRTDIENACEYLEQHGGTATPPKLHDLHKTSAKC